VDGLKTMFNKYLLALVNECHRAFFKDSKKKIILKENFILEIQIKYMKRHNSIIFYTKVASFESSNNVISVLVSIFFKLYIEGPVNKANNTEQRSSPFLKGLNRF